MTSRSTQRKVYDLKVNVTRRSQSAELRRLNENERLSPEQLSRLQRERALAIARHAFEQSPFYRDLYRDAGLSADDFRDEAVLDALPLAQKAAVRENFESIRTPEATPENTIPQVTGGSTGHPTRVLHDKRALQHLIAYRLHSWWGIAPSDNRALVWRVGYRPGKWRNRFSTVLNWPMRVIQLDANEVIGPHEVAEFFDRWARVRPALLIGYAGSVLQLARVAQESGRTVVPPLAIAATSSPISAAEKAFVSEVFGAPTYDHYQSIEVPIIAGECAEANGQHVFTDARWVEILDDAGRPVAPGETGELVITDLRNRAFPIVRYSIGDRASWKTEACPCGRPFPQLNPIAGRTTDNFVLPSGLVVNGETLVPIFAHWPEAVRQYQICQHDDLSITVRCVPGEAPDAEATMQRAVADVRQRVRDEVPVRLELVDEIWHDRGKTRIMVREAADGTVAPPSLNPSKLVADQRTASTDSTSSSTPFATS